MSPRSSALSVSAALATSRVRAGTRAGLNRQVPRGPGRGAFDDRPSPLEKTRGGGGNPRGEGREAAAQTVRAPAAGALDQRGGSQGVEDPGHGAEGQRGLPPDRAQGGPAVAA